MNVEIIKEFGERIHASASKVIIGQPKAVALLTVALLAEGHVLLEGVPGTGKTLLAKTFSTLLGLDFGRVQFTPDLMPADLLGSNLFNFQTSKFTLTKGPIFTEILLADEINRTPPKTQAALLEAMAERTVTLDGTRHELGEGFMVIATQNPIEQEGTYPLPEAQLDRFLFRVIVNHPARSAETQIVQLHGHQSKMPDPVALGLRPIISVEELIAIRNILPQIALTEPLVEYIVDLVRATRTDPNITTGASTRAANMLATSSRALAALKGRNYVIPDDIKTLISPALSHRLTLSPSAEIEGLRPADVLNRILERTEAPK